ncbi:hypothetical protein [Marinagarivorans algicola]|uniref:hypothetical protein n=1 Tax=Marinagarivorans algicola TaxID=1513270 RepID=UPI0006B9CABB|nr:hypothetical protein [Marinagarivorans algicola]
MRILYFININKVGHNNAPKWVGKLNKRQFFANTFFLQIQLFCKYNLEQVKLGAGKTLTDKTIDRTARQWEQITVNVSHWHNSGSIRIRGSGLVSHQPLTTVSTILRKAFANK